jgi:hypothetical protein
MNVTNHGFLTREQMLALLQPGALDPKQIAGFRVRWAYVTTRSAEQDTKTVSNALKELHLELGASEVLVHHGPWLNE